jgi:DsbE subfamily thiol:disulfide oxidoreductase
MKQRWLIVISILVALGAGFWFALPEAPGTMREGDQITSLNLPDLQGAIQTLPKGEVILLNFWATWCPPCRKEIPSMIKLHKKLAAQGLKIVAVSVDKNYDDLENFVNEHQMPFMVLHDADSIAARQYGVFRFPETFLIDRQGRVRHRLVGEVEWMSEPMIQILTQMLEEPDKRRDREVRGVSDEQSGSGPS